MIFTFLTPSYFGWNCKSLKLTCVCAFAGRTGSLRKIAENDFGALGDTSTLADPAVVDDLIANRGGK